MSKIEDGGPAFPIPPHVMDYNDTMAKFGDSGMTLRDYFAAKALQGLLAGTLADGSQLSKESIPRIAGTCYLFAEAMLAERAK